MGEDFYGMGKAIENAKKRFAEGFEERVCEELCEVSKIKPIPDEVLRRYAECEMNYAARHWAQDHDIKDFAAGFLALREAVVEIAEACPRSRPNLDRTLAAVERALALLPEVSDD